MKNQTSASSKKTSKKPVKATLSNGKNYNGKNDPDAADFKQDMASSNASPNSKTTNSPATSKSPHIGIDTKTLQKIHQLMNGTLSDQHVLYLKTRNFHWNLVGRRFHTLHLFLEEQYEVLETAIDETAERIRMVGGTPHASMTEFLNDATLEEVPSGLIEGDEAISLLLKDHEAVIMDLRKKIDKLDEMDDAGNADFFTDLMKAHEKTAWMLRSHLA